MRARQLAGPARGQKPRLKHRGRKAAGRWNRYRWVRRDRRNIVPEWPIVGVTGASRQTLLLKQRQRTHSSQNINRGIMKIGTTRRNDAGRVQNRLVLGN